MQPGYQANPPQYTDEDDGWYTVNFLALANGTSANSNINIESSSDFLWVKSMYFADIAAAAFLNSTRPIPNVTVILTDTGSGRQLMNIATPVPAVFGIGSLPFILPRPRLFNANSNINVAVANFDAAVTYNLRLTFMGIKKYL